MARTKAQRAAYHQANLEAEKASQARWRAANRETLLAKKAAYYRANRETLLAQKATYDAAHREERLAQKAAYYRANREVLLARSLAYQQSHPEVCSAKRARRRQREVQSMSAQDRAESVEWRRIIRNDPCFYCGATETHHVDHYVSLANGGTDHWWNLVRSCEHCNLQKNRMNGDEFLALMAEDPRG